MKTENFCFCKIVMWAVFVAACGLAVLFLGEAVASERQYKPHHNNITVDKRKIHRTENNDYSTHVKQNQRQKQKQKQTANGGTGFGGNSTSSTGAISVNSGDNSDYPVNSAWAAPAGVTAPCAIGGSAGGSGADISLSFNSYYLDEECVLNRDILTYITQVQAGVLDAATGRELIHLVNCQKASYRTASASVPGMECPEYTNAKISAKRPLRYKTFNAAGDQQAVKFIPATMETAHICDVSDLDCEMIDK